MQDQQRKVELIVKNYKIAMQMNVDCNLFSAKEGNNESYDMVENYLYKKVPSLRNIVKGYRQVDEFLPFKGAQTVENRQKIVEFEFEDFKQYEQFGRRINDLNEKIVFEFKNSQKSNQEYIDKLILKEKIHLLEYLNKEQSKYQQDDERFGYIQDLIQRYKDRPDKGSIFFESELHKQKQDLCKIELIKNLGANYKYTVEMVKYPFRMMEDDSKMNYILKLVRQSKCQLAGFNTVILSSDDIKIPENPTERIQLYCNSLEDITFSTDEKQVQCPLTILCWDIEVCTESGKFDNDGKNPENKVLCIGLSFGYLQAPEDKNKRIKLCLTWVDSADIQVQLSEFVEIYTSSIKNGTLFAKDMEYIVRMTNEMEMIHSFFKLVNLFDPSFITGFNDYQFDFPFLRDKIGTFNVTDGKFQITQLLYKGFFTQQPQKVLQGNGQVKTLQRSFMGDIWCSQSVKINQSDQCSGLSLDVMGIISIDTRILLMKTQKLEKKSLNDYLEANGLDRKLDVSFRDMNSAFRALTNINTPGRDIDKETMSQVFKYCIYDSEACFLLWKKRNILQQSIEVSKLSYTPLKYSFLNADGIKVRNMVAKFAYEKKFSVPMTTKSQDIRIRDIELLNKYEKYPGAYVSPPKKGISITPVSALDFNSLYPSIIMAHNLSPEKVVEPFEVVSSNMKTFRIEIPFNKDGQSEVLTGDVLTRDHNPGVYPEILQFLFASRKEVKTKMEMIQEMAEKTDDLQQKKELEFQATLLNCKQLAIKVFMNTFYGETGNQKSPLFDVIISGGTTTLGQFYIKQVHRYIENEDCEIVYGDTDSVYFRPRLSHFHIYRSNQESLLQISLSRQLLESAYEATERLKNNINEFIGKQTGYFLKMAFEELLLPSMFTGKKKYCGVVYVPGKMTIKESLTIKDILLRGIDFIKSQYPELIKQFGRETLISIMQHFMMQSEQFTDDRLTELFSDDYRQILNIQLKELIAKQILRLSDRLNNIQPEEYHLLSSKKKLRSAKTGQMMLFRQRFTNITNIRNNFIFSTLKEFALQIDIQQLQISGIAVPEDGEIIDLVSIKTPRSCSSLSGLKSSDLIHLLQYVKQRKLPINKQDYLKMFRTTASRILVSAFTDPTILDIEEQEKQSIKLAKVYCDELGQMSKDTLIQQTHSQLSYQWMDDTYNQFGDLVNNCIKNAKHLLKKETPDTNINQIYKALYRDLSQSRDIRALLYAIIHIQEIKEKIAVVKEQGQSSQYSELIKDLQELFANFEIFRVLPVILRSVYILLRDVPECNIDQVNMMLSTILQVYEWQQRCNEVIEYIEINKKLPPEMGELQSWLFKQRSVYIERLKQTNKKAERMPIIELIETYLLSSSPLIVNFFADSIWDYNYQLFKKDQYAQRIWVNSQIELFKSGQLSNTRVLKIQKINPEILV